MSTKITSDWQSKEARQFDFWIGEWNVNLRAIQKDLSWKDTTKAKVKIYPVLDGKAILELWDSPIIKGFSLRYCDASKGKWVLWLNWPNDKASSFRSLGGAFRHGRGEFFSKENGVISRFTFCDISPTSLRWDDAYSKDGGKTWTYDWVMEFSRSAQTADWPATSANAHTFAKPGTRCPGNNMEFDHVASIAGHWKGDVELAAGEKQTKAAAAARAYRILDGCATIQFVEFERDGKPFRLFFMLTYNSAKERFEELRLDNQKDSTALVLRGQIADGRLAMKSDGSSPYRTRWSFPGTDDDLQIESQDGTGATQLKTKLVLKKVTVERTSSDGRTPELKLSDAINMTCPRSGKAVVPNSLTTYRGVTVGFCNQHCRDDFASNVDERPRDREFFDDILAKRK